MRSDTDPAGYLADNAYLDAAGVYRWKTNDNVPFDDLLEAACVDEETRARCAATRDRETKQFFAEYRERMKDVEPSGELLAEMRAEFGEGTVVVDVITGRETRL